MWRCCSMVISKMWWHVGNGLEMYQICIDRVFTTANGSRSRQLKDDILDRQVRDIQVSCSSSRHSTAFFIGEGLATPRSAKNNRRPPSGSTCIVGCRSNMQRLENFLLCRRGPTGNGGRRRVVFSFSPSSKAESHPTMWPELSIFWPPTGGCGLTRMPGGPGATVEAIVRSGVGDKKIPLVSGGTTAEPHGRDRWLGGATGGRHFNVNVARRRPPLNRKILKFLGTFMDIWSAEKRAARSFARRGKESPRERVAIPGWGESGSVL